jgi:outer membrane protein OmpA-like peptidoglycan-associated protein
MRGGALSACGMSRSDRRNLCIAGIDSTVRGLNPRGSPHRCSPPEGAGRHENRVDASAASPSPETPAQAATSGNVQVSIDILNACGLSGANAYFPFDSAHLERQDIGPLNAIAVCFTAGKLKGRSMKLVGHADPRGAPDYNMPLGQARADAVQTHEAPRDACRYRCPVYSAPFPPSASVGPCA